jgi:hypothetical protein
MPRLPIDYSNTIIYKLCCNDPTITDIYVGHTTNWTNRKGCHKQRCNNENSKYNFYVYQFIREHGGWTNWTMVLIEEIKCNNKLEACKVERNYIELLGATLNINVPSRTKPEYYEENKEHIKKRQNNYYEENKEQIKEYQKEYREENKEQIKEKDKIKYEKNKEQIKEYQKEYNEKNKDIINEKQNNYYEKNKDIINEKRRLKRLEQQNINHLYPK